MKRTISFEVKTEHTSPPSWIGVGFIVGKRTGDTV
jgi:hypothetical protein